MALKTIRESINETLISEMRRDESIILIGEDLAGGANANGGGEAIGGVFGLTKGLVSEFGRQRVIDTPITESAFVGMAAGAALTGLRPVVELMFVDFIGVCFDQIYNQAAKFRYMFGGKTSTPLVIRATVGAGFRAGPQHSQTLHNMLTAVPGLKVVMPANAYDAKGLLTTALRGDDVVVFLEPKVYYDEACDVPDDSYTVPFGEAKFLTEGDDVTIVAISTMVKNTLAAHKKLSAEGISAEVIDPRTTSPLDIESIIDSVHNTGRLVIVDEAPPRCSVARDIAAQVCDQAFEALKSPIKTVTSPHCPVPFAPNLEDLYIPSVDHIAKTAKQLMTC